MGISFIKIKPEDFQNTSPLPLQELIDVEFEVISTKEEKDA